MVPPIGPLNAAQTFSAGVFTSVGNMTVPRAYHTANLLDSGKVVAIGGVTTGSTILASTDLYDPAAQTWAASGSMSTVRVYHTSITLADGSVLISGGFDGFAAMKSQEIYDPITGTCSPTGDMVVARQYHRATVLPASPAHPLGLVLLTGGFNTSGYLASAELFDPATGISTATGSMAFARCMHVAELLSSGDVLVATGGSGAGTNGRTLTAEIYKTATGFFIATANVLVQGTNRLSTALDDGEIMLIGGDEYPDVTAEAELFAVLPGVPLFGPPYTGQSLTYVSSTPITGAVEDWLSALGNERGCIRQDGEDGETYRARVRMIADAVSPLAIARAVDATATALPERWTAEPFNDGADPVVKLAANLGFFDGVFCDSDFCDDWVGVALTAKRPVANLECSGIRESRAYVRVDLAGQLKDPDGLVLYCDDGFCDDPAWGYPDIHVHPVIQGASQALLQEIQNKIAGGVNFDVYLENSTMLQQQGTLSGTTGGGGVPVFMLTPVSGTAWYLREGLVTGDVGGLLDPATQGIAVCITLDDGTVLQTAWSTGVVSLRSYELEALGYRGQRVTSIEGWGFSTVTLAPPHDLNLIGSFSVNTCTL